MVVLPKQFMRVLKGQALPRASHGEIAQAGSCRLRSTLAAAPLAVVQFSRLLLSQ
jgi:hypothetical protein